DISVKVLCIRFHEPGGDRLTDLSLQFRYRPDADLLAVGKVLPAGIFRQFGAPYRQRSTPIPAAAEVPIDHILQPVSETAFAGGFGFPVDRLIQLDHAILKRRGADEPGIEGVV